MGQDDRKLCVLCAWRDTCQKRFRGVEAMHCPDFTLDVEIAKRMEEEKGHGEKDKGKDRRVSEGKGNRTT